MLCVDAPASSFHVGSIRCASGKFVPATTTGVSPTLRYEVQIRDSIRYLRSLCSRDRPPNGSFIHQYRRSRSRITGLRGLFRCDRHIRTQRAKFLGQFALDVELQD